VSDSGVINVSMGAIPLSRLKNSQSGTGPAVGIDIRVKDCEKGTYYIVVDGPSPAGMPEHRVLALDGSGKPASNVGILLTDRTGTRSASMNASIRNTIPA
jgi:major type 1 subunit fimbrin (pilin)